MVARHYFTKSMNKKVLVSIISLLVLILAICVIVFISINKNEAPAIEKTVAPITVKSTDCNPYLNIETAVKTGDLKGCECLATESQKTLCKANVTDGALYARALSETDISICNNISDLGMKKACTNVVQGKIDFIQKNLLLKK